MADVPLRIRARVRHEPDRSYAVLVEGPEGEVLVGITGSTGELSTLAREGAARLFGVPADRIEGEYLHLVIPQPPYGRDGQWVRIISVEESSHPGDVQELGALGQAHWFGHEGGWFVTVAPFGTGIYPSEDLDFAPVVTDEEVAELQSYLESIRLASASQGDGEATPPA